VGMGRGSGPCLLHLHQEGQEELSFERTGHGDSWLLWRMREAGEREGMQGRRGEYQGIGMQGQSPRWNQMDIWRRTSGVRRGRQDGKLHLETIDFLESVAERDIHMASVESRIGPAVGEAMVSKDADEFRDRFV
jgi:hypothetical protein